MKGYIFNLTKGVYPFSVVVLKWLWVNIRAGVSSYYVNLCCVDKYSPAHDSNLQPVGGERASKESKTHGC